MKVKPTELRRSLGRCYPDARLFLLYGPDESGAADLAATLTNAMGENAERVELSGAQLKDDPSLLAGEAASLSLFGDKRVIVARVAGDDALGACEMLLSAENAINPAVIHATSLTDKGKLAKLVADHRQAVGAICYLPKHSELIPDMRRAASDLGLDLSDECASRIAAYTGMNRKLALMELEKLALYCDVGPGNGPDDDTEAAGPRRVTSEMLDALGAESEDTAIDPAVNCILNGDVARLGDELARIAELGLNEVGIVLALQRRVGSLAKLAPRAAQARSLSDFIKTERSIYFGEKPNYQIQLARWQGTRLESLNRRLLDLHQQLLYNSQSAEILFRQEMAVIASAAARSGGR